MLVALLALLGVNLIVVVAVLVLVLARKRWVMRQPGAFKGAIRLAAGEMDGLPPKWRRGYGHWVRDVLVWTKAPLLFRNQLIPTDGVDDQRPAGPGELKRLGHDPVVVRVASGSATVEVASRRADSEIVAGSRSRPGAASVAPETASAGRP